MIHGSRLPFPKHSVLAQPMPLLAHPVLLDTAKSSSETMRHNRVVVKGAIEYMLRVRLDPRISDFPLFLEGSDKVTT